MTECTAKIAAKGCSATGITEDLAKTLHDQLGRKVVAVVELVSETRSEKRDGKETVVLSILTIEPAPNSATEDHLRELARSFHYERQLADGQLELTDSLEPKVSDVLAAGAQHTNHPYLSSQLSVDDEAVCDVCGQHEAAAVHADRAQLPDPFSVPTTPDDEDDEEDEPDDGEPADLDDAFEYESPDPHPVA